MVSASVMLSNLRSLGGGAKMVAVTQAFKMPMFDTREAVVEAACCSDMYGVSRLQPDRVHTALGASISPF